MKYILPFLVPIFLYAQTTFITPSEYASQLYKNPRGIGCQNCHGDKGEGRLVATYIYKGKKKEFRGASLQNLNFDIFYKALNRSKKGMPRYYLTKKEIQALFFYIQEAKKDEK